MIDVFYMLEREREKESETISRKSSTQKHSDSMMLQDFLGQIFFSFLSLFRMVIPQFADIFGMGWKHQPARCLSMTDQRQRFFSRDFSWLAQQIQRSQFGEACGEFPISCGQLGTCTLCALPCNLSTSKGPKGWGNSIMSVTAKRRPR